ncbi:hypothetical protein Hypma_008642 [Hypsizygus marmoreus]|uniref:F-box domain-containing protein n=1 Tax=Hypsizygus marmoreus TaxID=39966 RepID=A0A369JQB2_HYPMA|nr:hypothetical protein Hypma_008642 [Hypsizygus marmoreus]
MQRRSTQKAKDKAEKPVYNVDESDDENTQRRKRRRKSQTVPGGSKSKAASGKRGKLEYITEMPLDILFEIFSHLSPSDLLSLARTSKPLRGALMHRSSTYVWKKARSHISGFPDCPNDLSEPQYANLAFDTSCHYCERTQIPNQGIVWCNRTRGCKKCTADNFLYGSDMYGVPRDILPYILLYTRRVGYGAKAYCRRTALKYHDEMKDLQGQALEEWCVLKKAEHISRMEHAELCEIWNQNRAEERSSELENIRLRRYTAIKEKLSAEGWGDEIAKQESDSSFNHLADHKLVRQPRDLTERIWNNVKKTLIDFMADCKVKRLEQEHRKMIRERGAVLREVLAEYASTQPLHAVIPSFADIAILDKFRPIIEDTPIDEEVTAAHFEKAMVELPYHVRAWRRSTDNELVEMMKLCPDIGDRANESMLLLATTFFRCQGCHKQIGYPRILVHKCATCVNFYDKLDESPFFRDLGQRSWNQGRVVSFDQASYRKARWILEDNGFDPDSETTARLNLFDPAFECRACSNSDDGRLIMRWPTVVGHMVHHEREGDLACCGLASLREDEKLLTELLEYAKRSPLSGSYAHFNSWKCIYCRRNVAWQGSFGHLKTIHPEFIPDDYDEAEHVHSFDEHLALQLDASWHILSQPVKVKISDPFVSFKDAFSGYPLFDDGQLDAVAEQMVQVFLGR